MSNQVAETTHLPTPSNGSGSVFSCIGSAFEKAQRIAIALSKSDLVPKEYKENVPNCLIALEMSERTGASPLMVMQNLVIVHNRPTWSAQFLISTVNTCGRFTALRYEFFGEQGTDTWGCRAWAIEKSTQEKLVGTDVTIAIAKKEGWYSKNGSKWQSIPQQMLMYRAGSWWTRVYAPELSMGMHTQDEAEDIGKMIDITPPANLSTAEQLNTEFLNKTIENPPPAPEAANDSPAFNQETGELQEAGNGTSLPAAESPATGGSSPPPEIDGVQIMGRPAFIGKGAAV